MQGRYYERLRYVDGSKIQHTADQFRQGVRMSSSPADSCLLFCLQLRLSPTLLSFYDLYDDMIFMFMTHAPGLPPSRHHHDSTSHLPHFHATLWEVPFGRSYDSLWEVLSGRWEVVFYSVRFTLLALRLWPWRCSQKNKTSFEDICVLSFAGLTETGTIAHRLWPTTPTSAYFGLL